MKVEGPWGAGHPKPKARRPEGPSGGGLGRMSRIQRPQLPSSGLVGSRQGKSGSPRKAEGRLKAEGQQGVISQRPQKFVRKGRNGGAFSRVAGAKNPKGPSHV